MRELPGKPDIAFTRWKLAVFVDGRFWHGHPDYFTQGNLAHIGIRRSPALKRAIEPPTPPSRSRAGQFFAFGTSRWRTTWSSASAASPSHYVVRPSCRRAARHSAHCADVDRDLRGRWRAGRRTREAGFDHVVLVENDAAACETLRLNRPEWDIRELDVRLFNADEYKGIDLLAGGVPCPPFSVAGKGLGRADERDLFPEVLRLASQCQPRALLIENVKGLMSRRFDAYRAEIAATLKGLGYAVDWRILTAAHYGVPQLRPRTVMVAVARELGDAFRWPSRWIPCRRWARRYARRCK